MGKGFAGFVDRVLRGRSNKAILNSSVGLASLEIGWPKEVTYENFEGGAETTILPFDLPHMLTNNNQLYNESANGWVAAAFEDRHPLFDFSAENFTLFGLDFPDMWRQFNGEPSEHHSPIYSDTSGGQSLAETLGLPDLPYGEMAHLAHMGMALYDTGRTFQDVWRQLGDYYEKHNTDPAKQGLSMAARLGKTITHPDMLHTLAARGTMLTVMGLLHPLGPLISIGVAYLCAHLVHSFFGLLERSKDTIRQIESVPVLGAIYSASGVKEWAERELPVAEEPITEAEQIDPYQEIELSPERKVHASALDGRLEELLGQLRANPA